MKIYLASRYSRRTELCEIRNKLHDMEHTITSRWLDTNWDGNKSGSSNSPPEYRREYAIKDFEDVSAADIVVSFTEINSQNSRGGHHVEFGIALGLKKKLVIIGPPENLFHYQPSVVFFENVNEFLAITNEDV